MCCWGALYACLKLPTMATTIRRIDDLLTPCFLVDRERLQTNVDRMRTICKDLGVSLRAHAKTHKTIEIAEMTTGGTRRGICVSTLSEAESYADAGFDDILLAHPITQHKIERCIKMLRRIEQFHVMVSDLAGVECLKNNIDKLPEGRKWSVAIEMDNGYARTGFLVNSKEIEVAFQEVMKEMTLLAIYCHCGSSYEYSTRKERKQDQENVMSQLMTIKSRILTEFPNAKFAIGIGSTPSCSLSSAIHRNVDEFHPGTFVFFDYKQYLLSACRQSDIAGRVMTRVIAHKEEQNMILVDCGFMALGHKGMEQRPENFCIFDGESNLKMVGMSQEIGKVKAKEGDLDCRNYPVGTVLYIYPYSSCQTANLHHVYYVHSGDKVVDTWIPIKGW